MSLPAVSGSFKLASPGFRPDTSAVVNRLVSPSFHPDTSAKISLTAPVWIFSRGASKAGAAPDKEYGAQPLPESIVKMCLDLPGWESGSPSRQEKKLPEI